MCQPQRLVLQTNDRCKSCQCAAHARFAFPLPLQQYTTSPTWKSCRAGSAPCARDLASTALDNVRSYRSEVVDLCAADIIAMCSENAPSLVTRSCRESLPVWSSSVYGSRSPRPRAHCAGEYPLSSMAELQAQAIAAGSHVTRCSCSGTKLDAELVKQSTRMCFPDSSMPLTDCVLLWSDGCCRHGFAFQVFELLSELTLEFSSLVVNQPSRHAKGSDPVFEEVVPHDLRMLAGNHGNNTKSVKNVNEAQLIAFIIRENKQVNGCRVAKLSVCAKSCGQVGSRMLLTLAHIASQLKCCANCSCAATSDTCGSCKCVVRRMSQIGVHLAKTCNQSSLLLGCEIRLKLISGSDSNSRGRKRVTWCLSDSKHL